MVDYIANRTSMKKLTYLLSFLFFSFLLLQCKKKDNPEPIDQLPPATQTGANTFGCLLNGQAWTPKGNNGNSNYRLSYDPTYDGGTFDLRTYRYPNEGEEPQYLILYSNNLSTTGTYSFKNKIRSRVRFSDHKTNCNIASYDSLSTYSSSNLTVTKLDLNQGIISGTFEFILAKPGCDTIKVTNGRFDKKL